LLNFEKAAGRRVWQEIRANGDACALTAIFAWQLTHSVKAIKAIAAAETKSLIRYIEGFRAGLPPQKLASMAYSFSVFLVPKTAHRAVKILQSNRKLRLGRTSLNFTIKGKAEPNQAR
jgi:uncharacterized protein YbjT (DUF2867 family)